MSTLNETPSANRPAHCHYGRRNAGKSSLINALTDQPVALVSDVPGTTTDPVRKAMEVRGLGACMLIDTAGFDDEGELGALRVQKPVKLFQRLILHCCCARGKISPWNVSGAESLKLPA